MRVALTRDISPAFARCELTHLARRPIDVALARAQHAAYEEALSDAGCEVRRLESDPTMPDAVFVEDAAVVLDEVAVVTRPGAESRRGEPAAVADALAECRPVRRIEPPGTLDGGDVLVTGRRVFVGASSRSNASGRGQLRQILEPLGYAVVDVPVDGCLHLKSAVTDVGDTLLLMNRAWVPREAFPDFEVLDVAPGEPHAANALRIFEHLIYPVSFPHTRRRLEACGLEVLAVDVSELQKAEGAVTCCSVVFEGRTR
jgi:dimethylargininase